MLGKYHVKIHFHTDDLTYEFDLKRKITIFCGDSGTGKTTLTKMEPGTYELSIKRYTSDNESVEDKDVNLLNVTQSNFHDLLVSQNNIFIIDDDIISFLISNTNEFSDTFRKYYKILLANINNKKKALAKSHNINDYIEQDTFTFEDILQFSDNYFILITRQEKIKYSIQNSYKEYDTLLYSPFEMFEVRDNPSRNTVINKFKITKQSIDFSKNILIITEDSKFGCEYYKCLFDKNVTVMSACGRTNFKKIFHKKNNSDINNIVNINIDKFDNVILIIDGAAFGACIDSLMIIINSYKKKYKNENIFIYSPECFEQILMKSIYINTLKCNEIDNVYNYLNTSDYLIKFGSWEQYYEKLAIKLTTNFTYNYKKNLITQCQFNEYLVHKDVFIKLLQEYCLIDNIEKGSIDDKTNFFN